MKTVKKVLSLVFGLALLLNVMSFPAMAADTHTITITSKTSGHVFQAYQVFAGDYSGTGAGVLSNITWGSGVDSAALLLALQSDATYGTNFAGLTTAEQVADKIAAISASTPGFPDAVAKIISSSLSTTKTDSTLVSGTTYNYAMSGLASGYYFVNEQTLTGEGSAYTKYMLKVLGADLTVAAKADSPSIVKKVKENNDPAYQNTWNDAADYNIGDEVPFRIVGLVPNMTDYLTYKYKMSDTLSSGLTLNPSTIKVYFVTGSDINAVATSTSATGWTELTSGFTKDTTSTPFTINFLDLKTTSGVSNNGFIIVEYTATLNQGAIIANSDSGLNKAGNPNVVFLTYSNNPNGEGEGNTPEDEVVVFTYSIPVHKVKGDEAATPLEGAKFAVFTDENLAKAAALNPSDANLASALKFTGSAGNYILGGTVVSLESTSSGKYEIKGLDQGTYYLVETAAPTGYNRITSAIKVILTPAFTAENYVDRHVPDTDDQLESVTVSNGGMVSASIASDKSMVYCPPTYNYITVVNKGGATLPETGGIGTTIFTLGGLILMLGAAIVFVAKRKLASQKTDR